MFVLVRVVRPPFCWVRLPMFATSSVPWMDWACNVEQEEVSVGLIEWQETFHIKLYMDLESMVSNFQKIIVLILLFKNYLITKLCQQKL